MDQARLRSRFHRIEDGAEESLELVEQLDDGKIGECALVQDFFGIHSWTEGQNRGQVMRGYAACDATLRTRSELLRQELIDG
jgi:hypothetical protein